MTPCTSPLELLLPGGTARRARVLGSGCPERLRPAHLGASDGWDLVVIAPSAEESRSRRWLHDASNHIGSGLAADGCVYILAGAWARRRITSALASQGLVPVERLLHRPDLGTSTLMVPLQSRAFQAAAARLTRGRWRRRAAETVLSSRILTSLLGHMHDSVGVLARRSGASGPPLASWLDVEGLGGVSDIRTTWRANRVRTILHLSGEPGAFVKVELSGDPAPALSREAAALARLAPLARSAGAVVPDAVLLRAPEACPGLRLSELPGVPARALLARRPARRDGILRAIGAWLEAWSKATCRLEPVDADRLESWVWGPARRLADAIETGNEYLAWLEDCGSKLLGRPVPQIATHNDLTMANLLIGDGDRLGVLDWESAAADGLPLEDFVYAAVDATLVTDPNSDRPAAFRACFEGDDATVGAIVARLRGAVDAPPELTALAFHGCWLRHAENELRRRAPGDRLPFLECARHAARIRWWQ